MEIIEEQVQKAREELRKQIPMSKYLIDHKLGYGLSESGKIRCPVHDDSSPSFFFDDSLGTGNCFGCGVKGTVLEIHYARMKQTNERYTQVKAIYDLGRKYGVTIPNLYKREISRYGKSHIRPSKRKRGEMTEDIARAKAERLTAMIKQLEDIDIKVQCYQEIDAMWRGDATALSVYKKVMDIVKEERAKQVRQARQEAENCEG
ncbi:CHC2 zinc finger domain-containing protein [Bacillus cereus]|uniref:CHC2 zinc finger domain-containing protein n=1 Tax=Bacillus cereus TaxID=1396 RepID=UPI000BFCB483|nr:CHC2 zinc finger domain-containing protein [Bacillus cereus]PGR83560.1 hypothetical protein COC63_06135 [Bacillus cereus]